MADWVQPKNYSSEEIDRAGDILTNKESSELDKLKAFEVLDNWRAIHSYPMHVFIMRIKINLPKIDNAGIGVQRLKRIPAIIGKLDRGNRGTLRKLKLSQLQDLGGCRAVLSDVKHAKKFCDEVFIKSELKHKRVTEKDFITTPRKSGYRGIHLVYRYHSDKGKKIYNGLLIEIQIRSRLQHLWATAVETVGFFTRQAIKSSEADVEWLDFFKLVSSAFAIMEGCPYVPNTPINEKELFLEIQKREKQLNVVKIMDGWRRAIKIINEDTKSKKTKKYQYYVLELNIIKETLNILAYTKNEETKAIERYSQKEKANEGKKEFDVVLVGADTPSDLEKAYPNYFVDSQEFLKILTEIIKKY